jgi:hypothetical protein
MSTSIVTDANTGVTYTVYDDDLSLVSADLRRLVQAAVQGAAAKGVAVTTTVTTSASDQHPSSVTLRWPAGSDSAAVKAAASAAGLSECLTLFPNTLCVELLPAPKRRYGWWLASAAAIAATAVAVVVVWKRRAS